MELAISLVRPTDMRWIRGSAAAIATVVLLAGCGQGGNPRTASAGGHPCQVPRWAGSAPGQGLAGPAVSALTGGAATHGFSLDGGGFEIAVPPAAAVPRVSRTVAECEALAAVDTDGQPLTGAYGVSGIAAGYGLVTVSARLPVVPWQSHYPGIRLPMPALARYQDRLAWVVMFAAFDRADCPVTTSPPTSASQPYHGYYYQAFVVDAATGGSALLYDEATPRSCDGPGLLAPSVTVPVELTSVRWTLDSRGPDGSAAKLTAYVPPCADYGRQADYIAYTNLVRVLAYAQVAAPGCGPPRPVTVYLPSYLPSSHHGVPPPLEHAPTGLYLTGVGAGNLP